MRNINRVELMGNVGKDPEVRFTPGGVKVATLSLATNEFWRNQKGENYQRTDWHRVVVWDPLASVVEKQIKKGSPLFVEGKLRQRKYEKGHQTQYIVEVVATNLLLVRNGQTTAAAAGTGVAAVPAAGGANSRAQQQPTEPDPLTITDEDIPF